MIISSSSIGMQSTRSYHAESVIVKGLAIYDNETSEARRKEQQETSSREKTVPERDAEEKTAWEKTEEKKNTKENLAGENISQEESREVEEQEGGEFQSTLQEWQSRFRTTRVSRNIRSESSRVQMDIRQITLRYIFELLFQKKSDRFEFREEWESETIYENGRETGQVWVQSEKFNLSQYNYREITPVKEKKVAGFQTTVEWEEENTFFQTQGKVVTADGREITFDVNVGMSREFRRTYIEDLKLGTVTMCDPLVINLDGNVANFSNQTFYFDIDADGKKDEISKLSSGSGYLALDKNSDGEINDGTELFGTATGNGFGDLAKYDEDGNGWIDEADSIWDKLQIWCMDEHGKSVLYRLSEKNVGAICLQNASTDYTLKEPNGRTAGAIRYSGVFLYEDGSAGTIQHVDVAKYDSKA